jgi:hypothetical protein
MDTTEPPADGVDTAAPDEPEPEDFQVFFSTEDLTIIFNQPDQSQVLRCSRQRGNYRTF